MAPYSAPAPRHTKMPKHPTPAMRRPAPAGPAWLRADRRPRDGWPGGALRRRPRRHRSGSSRWKSPVTYDNSVGSSGRGERGCVHAAADRGPPRCCARAVARIRPASSSPSTAAAARPTSTSCAASTSTTAPTSRPPSPACRSTCARTDTGLHRPELHHPRTRQAGHRRPPRPVLRERRRLRLGGRREHAPRRRWRPSPWARSATSATSVASSPLAAPGRRHADLRPGAAAQRRAVDVPEDYRWSTRCFATCCRWGTTSSVTALAHSGQLELDHQVAQRAIDQAGPSAATAR